MDTDDIEAFSDIIISLPVIPLHRFCLLTQIGLDQARE